MAHECEYCGQQCYCDCDDCGGFPQPSNCRHLTPGTACVPAAREFGWDVPGDCDPDSVLNDWDPDDYACEEWGGVE